MSESVNVSKPFFETFNEFAKNDGKIDQKEITTLKELADKETNPEAKKSEAQLVSSLENKDIPDFKVNLKQGKTEPVQISFGLKTKPQKEDSLNDYFDKLAADKPSEKKDTPVVIKNEISGFEPYPFTDVVQKDPESQKLYDSAFMGPDPEKNNRPELRKLANNEKALSYAEPMEKWMIIEKLTQVTHMTKEDESAIVNVIQSSAKKGDLGQVAKEMLGDEKFYSTYNRLSKENKEKIAPLFANNPPDFYPKDINKVSLAKVKELKDKGELGKTDFDAIIVPGYTPLGAKNPTPLTDKAKERLVTAAGDFKSGKAPFIIVSGGSVHPERTGVNEAMVMREYLINDLKIPADRIIVEGLARHSTTNLRNAGRIMNENGMKRAEIVSDPGFMGMVSQTDYFNMPFFNMRYQNNHGQWSPGEINPVEDNFLGIGNRRNSFVPNPGVMKKDYVNDPLDP